MVCLLAELVRIERDLVGLDVVGVDGHLGSCLLVGLSLVGGLVVDETEDGWMLPCVVVRLG